MGIFKAFSDGFKSGRERAKQDSLRTREQSPVKVVSSGRILEFHILEKRPEIARMYASQIEALAKALEKEGVKYSQNADGTVKLEYPNAEMAEDARKIFAHRM